MSDIVSKVQDQQARLTSLGDAFSYGAIIQHWLGLLPNTVSVVATALGGLWCAVQIIDTIKRWRGKGMR